jgi:hypothetical protein
VPGYSLDDWLTEREREWNHQQDRKDLFRLILGAIRKRRRPPFRASPRIIIRSSPSSSIDIISVEGLLADLICRSLLLLQERGK